METSPKATSFKIKENIYLTERSQKNAASTESKTFWNLKRRPSAGLETYTVEYNYMQCAQSVIHAHMKGANFSLEFSFKHFGFKTSESEMFDIVSRSTSII